MNVGIYVETKQVLTDICDTLKDRNSYYHHLEIKQFSELSDLEAAISGEEKFTFFVLECDDANSPVLAFANKLQNAHNGAEIILICGAKNFSLGDENENIIPLSSPISKDEFKSAVNMVLNKNAGTDAFLTVFTPRNEKNIMLDDIMYVEVLGHILRFAIDSYPQIHSKVLRIPLERAARPLFYDRRFLRPHRSYVINADHIERITRSEVHMKDGMAIPISRLKIDDLRRDLQDYQKIKAEKVLHQP